MHETKSTPAKIYLAGDFPQSEEAQVAALREWSRRVAALRSRDDLALVERWATNLLEASRYMRDGKMIHRPKIGTVDKMAADVLDVARDVRAAIDTGDAVKAARLGIRLGVLFSQGAGVEECYGPAIEAGSNYIKSPKGRPESGARKAVWEEFERLAETVPLAKDRYAEIATARKDAGETVAITPSAVDKILRDFRKATDR